MIRLCSPESEGDLALLKSMLQAADIAFFVHNEQFASMRPGPGIPLYNVRTMYVARADYPDALSLVESFYASVNKGRSDGPDYPLLDRVRMCVETLVFGWFMPGKCWK